MPSSVPATSLHQKGATPEEIGKYEPVIGLEVHVQLNTRTKIFCGCPTGFGAPPNSNVCPVCLGLPGALPVLNRRVVEMAIQAALATHCKVNAFSRFARKNYFYPDLPKGYQISQYDQPLAEHGWLDVTIGGAKKRIGITRIHLEDDAGKSIHDGFKDSERYTYVDLNRSGTPLIEIVSDPDIRSSEEAYEYLTELKQILQYVAVSECDMEKGQLRCDANVSVRLKGAEKFGTKVEVKNLNSFRFAKMAMDYEIARQVAVVEGGGRIEQESRLYNVATGETVGMRSKEHAHDYRYFPEPDLIPLRVSAAWLEQIRATVPELPADKRSRFIESYGLREYDAGVLTSHARNQRIFREGREGGGRSAHGRELGDGRSAGCAERPGDHRIAGVARATWRTGGIHREGRDQRQDGQGHFRQDVRYGRIGGGNHRSRRPASDQRYGRAGENRGRSNCREPEAGGAVQGGKTGVIGYLVGQVMKAEQGAGEPGGGE